MSKLLDKDNPLLRQIAKPVDESELGSEWLKKLVQEMFAIMEERGAVGVAAPQLGISKRIIVFSTNYTKHRKPEYPIPDTTLINPILKNLTETIQTDYEGCLNCGEVVGLVPRAMEIEYSGLTLDGQRITKKATGLEARILQHEIDHLNGILFIDHVKDKESFTTKSALRSMQQSANKEEST